MWISNLRIVSTAALLSLALTFVGCGDDASPTDEDYTAGDNDRLAFFYDRGICLDRQCPLDALAFFSLWEERLGFPPYISIKTLMEEDELLVDWSYESSNEEIFFVRDVTCGSLTSCNPDFENPGAGTCEVADPECDER